MENTLKGNKIQKEGAGKLKGERTLTKSLTLGNRIIQVRVVKFNPTFTFRKKVNRVEQIRRIEQVEKDIERTKQMYDYGSYL